MAAGAAGISLGDKMGGGDELVDVLGRIRPGGKSNSTFGKGVRPPVGGAPPILTFISVATGGVGVVAGAGAVTTTGATIGAGGGTGAACCATTKAGKLTQQTTKPETRRRCMFNPLHSGSAAT